MENKLKLSLKLFLTFLKISCLTFGGGYAILPLLKSEVTDKNKWLTQEEVYDIFTISQLVPGLIYVSSATFIGHRILGIAGAALATAAVMIPSAVSIMIISLLLTNYFNHPIVQRIFLGIICGVTVLTLITAKDLIKSNLKSYDSVIFFILSFILLQFLKVKAVYIIVGSILIGVVYSIYLTVRYKNA